jgi:hypothetical protein
MSEVFHAQNGLSFERVDTSEGYGIGAVRVLVEGITPEGESIKHSFVLDASTWASVVASMSSLGETALTYALVLIAQQGGFIDDSGLITKGGSDD